LKSVHYLIMLSALAFVCVLGLAAARRSEFIVNGEDVDIANYPWQGSYRTATGSHTCGCVYMGANWVLTAGHCGGSSAYSVGLGNSGRSSVDVFGIAGVTRDPDYDQGAGFTPNDFAVVELTETPSGTNIAPATLASDGTNPETDGAITGWGRTCGSCPLPETLQGVDPMPIISDDECNGFWGLSFQSSVMICVYNGNQGSCNGDSGGPLTVGSTLYGLTSWGVAGCGTDYPSVYAKVGAKRDWICATGPGITGC